MDDWSLEAVLFITMMLVIILMMVVDHDDDDDATCVNCECEPTPEEPGVSICWFGWTGITIIHSDLSGVSLKHLQPTKRTILPPKISTFQTLEISFQPFSSLLLFLLRHVFLLCSEQGPPTKRYHHHHCYYHHHRHQHRHHHHLRYPGYCSLSIFCQAGIKLSERIVLACIVVSIFSETWFCFKSPFRHSWAAMLIEALHWLVFNIGSVWTRFYNTQGGDMASLAHSNMEWSKLIPAIFCVLI